MLARTKSRFKSQTGGAKPRILHVGPVLPSIGGMQMNVQQFLESDVSKVFDITNIRANFFHKTAYVGWRRFILNVLNGILLVTVFIWTLLKVRPHLVHVRTSSFVGFYEKSFLALISWLTGHKVIMHIHGGGFGDFYERSPSLFKRLIKLCLNLNSRVFVLSPQMRQVFLDIGLKKERLVIVADAVFMPTRSIFDGKRHLLTSVDDGVRVLFLNRITVEKGVMELVDAAACVCRNCPNVRFQAVGPKSPVCNLVHDRIRVLGLTGKFRIGEAVLGEQKAAVFLSADIYVLPTHVEGMSMGLLEAMSYGLACIATRVGGIPSLIEDGDNGLLVGAKDIEALANAIERLVVDTKLRRDLGEAGRRTVQRRFSWDVRAREIIGIYKEVISGHI